MHASAAKQDRDKSLPVEAGITDGKDVIDTVTDNEEGASTEIAMSDKGGFVVHAS
jgi:hypothetical protein